GKRPALLLLDEPMADLDPLARHELMGTLIAPRSPVRGTRRPARVCPPPGRPECAHRGTPWTY
ncbi:hypothetical protein ACWCRI_30670, partial [Streptomyces collinus]